MARMTFADPWRLRKMALRKGLMVDTFRGRMRVRKWPRKRGKPKSAKVLEQNAWFKAANELTRQAAPSQQRLAIEITKKSGLYPRDLLMRSISGGVFDIALPDGQVIRVRRKEYALTVFQGARVSRTTDVVIPSPGPVGVVWQQADIDTAGMWSIGDPTWLTIPPLITLCEFSAGVNADTGTGNGTWRIDSDQGEIAAIRWIDANVPGRLTFTTGPLPVTPGHKWRLSATINSSNRNLNWNFGTYLACSFSTIPVP